MQAEVERHPATATIPESTTLRCSTGVCCVTILTSMPLTR